MPLYLMMIALPRKQWVRRICPCRDDANDDVVDEEHRTGAMAVSRFCFGLRCRTDPVSRGWTVREDPLCHSEFLAYAKCTTDGLITSLVSPYYGV